MRCPQCRTDNPSDSRYCKECAAPLASSPRHSVSQAETLTSPPPGLALGSLFAGRYRIIEELGAGGMGRVYKAHDQEVEEKVALKMLKPEIALDEAGLARFRSELKLARGISHKNVCRMYDLGQSEGGYFITMEYVPGEDLKSFIRRSGQLTVAKAADIGAQIGEGLAEAHRLGVVHRDLKPQNIMIDQEGNARIMDFGIARTLRAPGLTEPGVAVGTPEYMAPEQVEGQAADQRSDIYALGAILFEMLTGRTPFQGETPFSVALKHKTEAPPDPAEFNPQVPAGFSRLVLKCLDKDKGRRFQKAEDLLPELNEFGRGTAGVNRAQAARIKAKGVGKGAWPFWLVPGGVLAVLVLLVGGYFLLREKSPAPKPDAAGPPVWKNSVAVLPLKDYSPGKHQEDFCAGMTDAIIIRLSQIQELKVTNTSSVMHFKDTEKDIQQIGTELGVANLLDGAVRRDENRIRVTTQLISRDTKFVVWSKEFEQEMKGIFDLQDRIAQSIAEALKVRLLPEVADNFNKDRPKNLQAYEYYVKGMSFIKGKYVLFFREDDFKTGVAMFNKAIELDPSFSLAYFGLSWAYAHRYDVSDDPRDRSMIEKSAEISWRLDPSSAYTNAVLGYVLYEFKNERDRAFEYFKKALAINANIGEVNFIAGLCYLNHGLYDLGVRYLTRSLELDPYNFWTPYKLGWCYTYTGDYDKADYYFKKYFELAPPIEPLLFPGRNIALQLMMKRYDRAEELIRRGERMSTKADWVKKYRAMLWAAKGEKERALALWKDSDVYSLLGMRDEAFQALDREIRKTVFFPYIFYINLLNNPFYDQLRDDPRFGKLVKREKNLYDEAIKKIGLS